MNESRIKGQIDNSIRSLFQMIAAVEDVSGDCVIIDHNSELALIRPGDGDEKKCPFKKLRRRLLKNIHPEDRDEFLLFSDRDIYVRKLRDRVHLSMECRIRHTDSRYHWSEIIICNTTAEDSTEGDDCLFMIRDIDERKCAELEREAEERAILKSLQEKYDALFEENMTDQQTGCYNRKGLRYYSDIVLDEARKNDRNLFVCVADLNGLKHLNDTYGHAAGDEAISAVSSALKAAAPKGSRVVRIGGDEFMIFAAVEKDSTGPDRFGPLVDEVIKAYNAEHSNPYEVGASYGWVVEPPKEGMTGLDEYIEMADAKMYEMRAERDKYRRDL